MSPTSRKNARGSRIITFFLLLVVSLPIVALLVWFGARAFYREELRQFGDQLVADHPIAVPLVMALLCTQALMTVRREVKGGAPLEGWHTYHALLFGISLIVYVVWLVVAVKNAF